MAAGDDADDGGVVGELEEHGRGEQLGVLVALRVDDEPAVEAGRDALQVGLVEDRLAEGAEQRGDRADGGKTVPPHITDEGPDDPRPPAYVEEVAADQRLVLRGLVQAREPHAPDPFRQRRQHRELGRLGDRADRDELGLAAAAHPCEDHTEQGDEGDRQGVAVAGTAEPEVGQQEQHDHGTAHQRGGGGPVRQGGQRRRGHDQEGEVHRLGGEPLEEGDHHQEQRRRPAQPGRGRRSAQQPVALLRVAPSGRSPDHLFTLLRARGHRTPGRSVGCGVPPVTEGGPSARRRRTRRPAGTRRAARPRSRSPPLRRACGPGCCVRGPAA